MSDRFRLLAYLALATGLLLLSVMHGCARPAAKSVAGQARAPEEAYTVGLYLVSGLSATPVWVDIDEGSDPVPAGLVAQVVRRTSEMCLSGGRDVSHVRISYEAAERNTRVLYTCSLRGVEKK